MQTLLGEDTQVYVDAAYAANLEGLSLKTERHNELLYDTNDFTLLKNGLWLLLDVHRVGGPGPFRWRLRRCVASQWSKLDDVEDTYESILGFLSIFLPEKHSMITEYCPNIVAAMDTTHISIESDARTVIFASWLRGIAGMYIIATTTYEITPMIIYCACLRDVSPRAFDIVSVYDKDNISSFLSTHPIIRENIQPFERYHRMMTIKDLCESVSSDEDIDDDEIDVAQ